MSSPRHPRRRCLCAALAAAFALSGCSHEGPKSWQGYLEGDFVYVSSPLAGRLDVLTAVKGSSVAAGAPLFELEHGAESDSLRQSTGELEAATAQLEDLGKGSRPEEIAALQARVGRARAAAEDTRLEYERQKALLANGAVAPSEFDHARLAYEADQRSVDEEEALLATARLGGRADAVAAARANANAAREAQARALWSVEQKRQAAPADALVYDTLYRQGEFVPAGAPVVSLLPPSNLKVRFFVAEPDLAAIRAGDGVRVCVAGIADPIDARVSYVSPKPEYTPPVLYNRDNRAKLVYMVEATFAPKARPSLHPGQPVDVVPAAK